MLTLIEYQTARETLAEYSSEVLATVLRSRAAEPLNYRPYVPGEAGEEAA
jgi:hypothetical protein